MPPMNKISSRLPAFFQPGVYAITPEQQNTQLLLAQTEQALQAGVRLIQYRNKSADKAEKTRQAKALLELCATYQTPLIINDDVELCAAIQADGVHLGRDDGEISTARAQLGTHRIIGISCYNQLARAQNAVKSGADYIAFGSCFSSATKPNATHCSQQTIESAIHWLNQYCASEQPCGGIRMSNNDQRRPAIVAIGGITAENGASLINLGVDYLAVISDLFSAPDIQQRTYQYQQIFTQYQLQGRV